MKKNLDFSKTIHRKERGVSKYSVHWVASSQQSNIVSKLYKVLTLYWGMYFGKVMPHGFTALKTKHEHFWNQGGKWSKNIFCKTNCDFCCTHVSVCCIWGNPKALSAWQKIYKTLKLCWRQEFLRYHKTFF